MMFPFLILLIALPALLVALDFFWFLLTQKHLYRDYFLKVLELVVVLIIPFVFVMSLDSGPNDCCGDSAVFSPEHRLSIYTLIVLCALAYFYTNYKNSMAGPVVEVLVNIFLLLGIVINILLAIQMNEWIWLLGNLPIILLFIRQLIQNHRNFLTDHSGHPTMENNGLEGMAWRILKLNVLLKIPLLCILALPLLVILMCFLLLFGQKPDALVRAFTDTYKHGFSQLDQVCDNVNCGGHFLCSVAANGHTQVVKPIRYGERHGNRIICNRQLLVANAFEELMEQKLPLVHKLIRQQYNKVGNMIHKHYGVFNHKGVSDVIYILMKPLELFFLLTIYILDHKPENRIAKQYLNAADREELNLNA